MSREHYRLEEDLLGSIRVPGKALYGAQTQRAIENFPLAGERAIGDYHELIEGLMAVKKAAASANKQAGLLDGPKVDAIAAGADLVLSDELFDQFPLHRLHGGGGTSANMNANEVLANIAEESLGGRRGEYRLIHPNDHVNLNQSTNDVYPTACHISIIRRWSRCQPAFENLAAALMAKGTEWKAIKRLARTCLQDAVVSNYEALFSGWAAMVRRATSRIAAAVDALHAVNLGGTVVGHGDDVPEAYLEAVVPALCVVTADNAFARAVNLYDATQNLDDMVNVAAQLELLARGMIRVAKDLRLLASGPEGGLGELQLPAAQPGSSAMPGKINPVIPEFVIQLGFDACGKVAACTSAIDHGELDLNVWESLVVFNVLDAMELLANASSALETRCVKSLGINVEVNRRHANTLMPTLARLAARHGYTQINAICRRAAGDLDRLRSLLSGLEHELR
jgi:aspartate ammonia-lyase